MTSMGTNMTRIRTNMTRMETDMTRIRTNMTRMGRPAVALTILSLLLPIGTALGKHKFYQINTKFQETLSCNQFEYLYQEHLVVFLISMKSGIVECKMSFAPLDIVFVEQLLPQGSFPNQIQLAFLHIPVPCTLVIF